VCTDFKSLEFKVPLIFPGPVGFSTCRKGRYVDGLSDEESRMRLSCLGAVGEFEFEFNESYDLYCLRNNTVVVLSRCVDFRVQC
jgi:hypothetical protein